MDSVQLIKELLGETRDRMCTAGGQGGGRSCDGDRAAPKGEGVICWWMGAKGKATSVKNGATVCMM